MPKRSKRKRKRRDETLISLPSQAFTAAEISWMANRAVDWWFERPNLDQPPFNEPLHLDQMREQVLSDPIVALMKAEGLSYPDAVEALARRSH